MGVKYRIDYKNYFDEGCRVDISTANYFGEPILLRAVDQQACVISYDLPDDPYEPICNSKATIVIDNHGGVDASELREAADRDFTVEFYINTILKFRGFVIPDGIQNAFQSLPYDLTITATDGLMLLDTIDYSDTNVDANGGRCILNYLRSVLFGPKNLNNTLPIRWVNTLKNLAYPLENDVFSGSVEWSSTGEGYADYNGNNKSCMYVLEGLLRSMQSRISQSDGYWKVDRINDIGSGEYFYRETPGTMDGFTVSDPVLTNVNRTITGDDQGAYRFIEEDAILRTAKGLKSVTTTYNQNQRDNILPNGNMDMSSLGQPIYWQITPNGGIEMVEGFDGKADGAAELTVFSGSVDSRFKLVNNILPIDSDILYSSINFGFKFSMVAGYPVDGDGLIIWGANTLRFRLIYNNGVQNFYLNEFGYWTDQDISVNVTIANLKLGDVASVDFNARQDIILPLPAFIPIERAANPSLSVEFFVAPGQTIIYDDIYLNTDNNSDVAKGTFTNSKFTGNEDYSLNISSSHNGFYVSNFMSNFSESGLEKFFTDGKFTGTLTAMNSHAILRNRYRSSLIFEGSIYGKGWSFGEIYEIQTLTDKKFLPLACNWNTETCTIKINAIEVRDDNLGAGINIEYYGKNDNDKL